MCTFYFDPVLISKKLKNMLTKSDEVGLTRAGRYTTLKGRGVGLHVGVRDV